MNKHQLFPNKPLKQLVRAAVISSVCLLTASSHAAFVAESHACTSTSDSGSGGVGGYY
jgi:hypothetical protein